MKKKLFAFYHLGSFVFVNVCDFGEVEITCRDQVMPKNLQLHIFFAKETVEHRKHVHIFVNVCFKVG